jgi:hypothetical protein
MSRRSATRPDDAAPEVTEAIGEELRVRTLDVAVRAADGARSLNGFDSVVRCCQIHTGHAGIAESAGLYLSRHGIGGGFTGVRPVRSHGMSCEALALDFVDDHRERRHNRDCQ